MQDETDVSHQESEARGVGLLGVRKESELERYDRNLNELLGELRVALPGVQVLFAFLLVVPFNQRFTTVSHFEKRLYLATLLCTLLASILLIAPTMVHRLSFGRGVKGFVVRASNRLMIAGLVVFAIAMACAVLLVTDFLFGATTAAITTAAVVMAFTAVWFVLPLRNRRAHARMSLEPTQAADERPRAARSG